MFRRRWLPRPRLGAPPGLVDLCGDRFQEHREVARGRRPCAGILLEAALDKIGEGRRHVGKLSLQRRRFITKRRGHRLRDRRPQERLDAGQRLVDDRAEREQIGAGRRRLAEDLLGRDVAERAHQHALLGGEPRRGRIAGTRRLDVVGQPEIEDLDAAFAGDEQVFRLEIAVDDAAFVGGGKAADHLARVVENLPGAERAGCAKPRPQRLALEQLGHDIRDAGVVAEIVKRENVRVIEGGDGTRLPFESRQRSAICATSPCSTLIATSRPRRVSRAL